MPMHRLHPLSHYKYTHEKEKRETERAPLQHKCTGNSSGGALPFEARVYCTLWDGAVYTPSCIRRILENVIRGEIDELEVLC